jgi:bifunctional UDP-N-acetylglucosamine pyrophosphorylase/glucosamine-1-phosphate N-acetyltransferase
VRFEVDQGRLCFVDVLRRSQPDMTYAAPTQSRTCLAVILAAGEGKRMQSGMPKVLHRLAGRSMLGHSLASVLDANVDALAIVLGPGREDVAAEARACAPQAEICVQTERRGTAHAVRAARAAIERGYDDLLVVFADTPLVRPQTYSAMRRDLAAGAAVVVLGFEASDPSGYGRLILENDGLAAIREERDASQAERALRLCNAGLMAIAGHRAREILDAIGHANAQNEYYLTDAVAVARRLGLVATSVIATEDEVMGVNDRQQLARAEALMQQRLRCAAMLKGATLIAPETVYFSYDTELGRDVLVEPHVFFGPGVTIEDRAIIHGFSHLEGAHVGEGANVGPFARLRPGARLGADAKVGNFVEIKAADIEAGAKISHLSYIGDARVGAEANIGAGTITCNYDGFDKFHTDIGAGAFIGSNSALVAPVKIGAGAYVGSGSVVTKDVAADALAVARGRQVEKPGWAKAFRTSHQGKPRKR